MGFPPRRLTEAPTCQRRQRNGRIAKQLNEQWTLDFVSDTLFNGKRIRALT